MNKDPIVLNFYESLLRQSDVDLLEGTNWLNDTIISFYFEYLERIYFKDYKNLLFIPPQVTQCIKIVQVQQIEEIKVFLDPLDVNGRDFIFFALNDNESSKAGGTHWSLLVYSKPERKWFHFDSSGGMNHDQAWDLATRISRSLKIADNAQFEENGCLQQDNGYDCGLHLICNTENIAQQVIKNGTVKGVPDINGVETKRLELQELIQELRVQDLGAN